MMRMSLPNRRRRPDPAREDALLVPVTIRLATAGDDEAAITRVADRDSRQVPAGPWLVAERAGTIEAVLSLSSGEIVADPFRRTLELVELLRRRAAAGRAFDPGDRRDRSRARSRRPPRPRARRRRWLCVSGAPTIRRELRPGDLGAIIAHHGTLYAREHGVDADFEAHVAASVSATAAKRGWPAANEAVWIVERGVSTRQPGAHRRGRRPRRAALVRARSGAARPRPRHQAGRRAARARQARRLRGASGWRRSATCAPPRTSIAGPASSFSGRGPGRAGRAGSPTTLRAQLPAPSPVLELGERRAEGAALLGQRIGDPGRAPVVD